MRERFGRACGKVILLGEHAVVYGVPALAIGIDRGASAVARVAAGGESRLRVAEWGVDVSASDDERDLGKAFAALLRESGVSGVEVDAVSELPPGAGLGCSAALGVAIARAVDPDASLEQVLERGAAWERIFHGNPSGVDTAAAARGGAILFRRGHEVEPLALAGSFVLAVGHSGTASSTRSMVESVARQRQRRPDIVDKTFEGIRSLVQNAKLALEAHDLAMVGKLMEMNQMLLSGLMLSTPEIEQLCALARTSGSLGAKLTGAGGGGCVVALAPSMGVADDITRAWKEAGYQGFVATVGQEPTRVRAQAEVTS